MCVGFIGAGILINKSYKEWQEHPIATSITTHPIDDLDFPKVTICPPRDSNTALYHDLVRAGNGSLSDENRRTLKRAAYEIFMERPHKEYAKKMLDILQNMGNMNQFLQGFHSLPTSYNEEQGLKIAMWNLNGTITTPWFGNVFMEEYYREDKEFLMVLELPDDIKEQVGSGSLTIELNVDTREETGWVEEVTVPSYTFHPSQKTWSEAESDCQREGGNLASVASEEVNKLVRYKASGSWGWLGARKELGMWTWSDNSRWVFTSWSEPSGGNCVLSYK